MKLHHRNWIPTLALVVSAGVVACSAPDSGETVGPEETAEAVEPYVPEEVVPTVAHAVLSPADGQEVAAAVTFTEVEGGVEVTAWVEGAAPGSHGFHLHETGDCSAADFTSAGGHFNPTDVEHAGPEDAIHHAGDWGNLTVHEDGTGKFSLVTPMLTVGEGSGSVVGKAVVLHAGEDDLTSQPSGAAGARIACGVVALGPPSEGTEGDGAMEEAAGDDDPAESSLSEDAPSDGA